MALETKTKSIIGPWKDLSFDTLGLGIVFRFLVLILEQDIRYR